MIFASDLDRTLIFSERYVPNKKDYLLVEHTKSGYESFILQESFSILSALDFFVPVTTRNESEWKRTLLYKELKPHFAIVSNGEIVLENGMISTEWQAYLQQELSQISLEDILPVASELLNPVRLTDPRICSDYMVMFKVLNAPQTEEYSLLCETLSDTAWTATANGNKIYVMPKVVTKESALRFVQRKLGGIPVFGAGDSIMDLGITTEFQSGAFLRHPDSVIPTQNVEILAEDASASLDLIRLYQSSALPSDS